MPDEIRSFIAERSDAPERACGSVVDCLLDSQAWGHRWARHWLDVVRFAGFWDQRKIIYTPAGC